MRIFIICLCMLRVGLVWVSVGGVGVSCVWLHCGFKGISLSREDMERDVVSKGWIARVDGSLMFV